MMGWPGLWTSSHEEEWTVEMIHTTSDLRFQDFLQYPDIRVEAVTCACFGTLYFGSKTLYDEKHQILKL